MASLELTRVIDAPPDLLWRAISTAEGLSTWHADQVTGSIATKNFQVGWPSLNAQMELHVQSVDPGHRVVLRAGQSRVELSLEAGGVRLVHEGLDEADDLRGFRSSWALALSLLDHAATRHPGTTRRVDWFFERVHSGPELVHFYFSSAVGLQTWLGKSGDIGPAGSPISIAWEGRVQLHGEVLAHEPERDLALSWRELSNAALVLRTLPAAGGARSLALSLSTYGQAPPPAVLKHLERGLSRLGETLRGMGRT